MSSFIICDLCSQQIDHSHKITLFYPLDSNDYCFECWENPSNQSKFHNLNQIKAKLAQRTQIDRKFRQVKKGLKTNLPTDNKL